MGKMIFFVTFLVLMEALFIFTGQACTSPENCTLGSIIFEGIINPSGIQLSTLFQNIVGDVTNFASSPLGFAALLATAGAFIGTAIFRGIDVIIFVPIGLTLSLLTADIVTFIGIIPNVLISTTLSILIVITYIFTILDWMRGKD